MLQILLFFFALCNALIDAAGHQHMHHQHKREGSLDPTTTITDYAVVDVTLTLSDPLSLPSNPAIKAEQKDARPQWGGASQWDFQRSGSNPSASTSSGSSLASSSPSSSYAASSSTTASSAASIPPSASLSMASQQQPGPPPSISSAPPQKPATSAAASGGQSTGGHIVASISSISSPTAAVLSATSIIGTVCTASVSQLPSYFADVTVQSHNVHRNNHSSTPIQWDNDLASYAASWASYCNFSHNSHFGGGYGQNIAAGSSPADISKVISDQFYGGEVDGYTPYYGIADPKFPSNFDSLHFSQVVWNSSTHVGCATIDCSSCGLWMNGTSSYATGAMGKYMTVCNYKVAGNMAGQYANNVFKSLNQPPVYGTTASG